MKCEEVRLSLGGFVLGGLESAKAAEVRRHLALCPGCQNELKTFERITQALKAAPPPIDPPSHLKDEILARMRAEKLSSSDQEMSSPSVELSSRAEPRFRNLRFVLSGVAAVGLVAALVAIVALGVFFSLQTSPSVAVIQLIPTEEEENYWGVAELHPQPSGNQQVVLELNNLDEPRPGSFYEMWFVSGEKYISAGTFTVTPEGKTEVRLSAPLQARDYHTVLITEESAAGATDPGKEVKLRGEVP